MGVPGVAIGHRTVVGNEFFAVNPTPRDRHDRARHYTTDLRKAHIEHQRTSSDSQTDSEFDRDVPIAMAT
jgi:hypothetical protein